MFLKSFVFSSVLRFQQRFAMRAAKKEPQILLKKIILACSLSLSLCSWISIAAPPHPYLFFDEDAMSGELIPKAPENGVELLEALDDCCLANEQVFFQPDGIEYVLALKIDFVDMPGRREGAAFDRYLFAPEGVSLKTYFRENSYGQMDIQPGPMGRVLPAGNRWIRAKKPMTYYGEGGRNLERYRELVREACQAVDAGVDFSKYDRDGDGIVDHVFVIHSGNDQASTGVIDDIASLLIPSVNAVHDGVRVNTAAIVAEEPDFEHPHLGIYFHEFFHDFGVPDVYGFDFTDARDHKWGLMSQFGPYQGPDWNGLQPSHIMGYLKWDFDARPQNGRHGWIHPVEITENQKIEVPSFELAPGTNKLFKIEIHSSAALVRGEATEFFLIENRNKTSGATFDTYLPESGLLIWHIDETDPYPLGSHDASQQIWLEDPADPKHLDIVTITDGAAYSADDQQTAFTPRTLPNSNANDGSVTGISITNIGSEGLTLPVRVSFGGPDQPPAVVVSIPDANLATAIRNALKKPRRSPLTSEDMLALTHLWANQANIRNLTGLEHAENLRELHLSSNRISDVSSLSELPQLKRLFLGLNNISDVSALSGLTQLTHLVLFFNEISDVSALSKMHQLTWLELRDNKISDVSALSELPQLTTLILWNNPLSIASIQRHIPAMQAKGIDVKFDMQEGEEAPASPHQTVRLPKRTQLLANYPNPFNPETWIPYQLATDSDVRIRIYDVLGTHVRHFDLGHQPAGLYESRSRAAYWDGRNELGERVGSGVYFYTLRAGDFTATRALLIKK